MITKKKKGNEMGTSTTWAIIDAAAEQDLFSMLDEIDPPHACLYADPVPDEISQLAPYLVQVTKEVGKWLNTRDSPWGIFLESHAEMVALRQHLRKYLHVQIPNEEKPVVFRFYDPRNIWTILEILSPWEQHSFLGPVTAITTMYRGAKHEKEFSALRKQYPPGSVSRRKLMKITDNQMEKLNAVFEQRYIDDLVVKLSQWNDGTVNIDTETVGETFRWLKIQNITDDRSIRGLFRLFLEHNCLNVEKIPTPFKMILCDKNEEGVYKAEMLLLRELGDVPL